MVKGVTMLMEEKKKRERVRGAQQQKYNGMINKTGTYS